MGQVAFDTQEFVEMLENAGLPKDQARAISIAVRKSHEVADVATRRDLEDAKKDIGARFDKVDAQIAEVRKDLSAEIAEARKDTAARFEKVESQIQSQSEKTDAKIAEVRKEAAARADKTDAQIALIRKEQAADIALVRKDMEVLTNGLLIKLTKVMLGYVGLASAIVTIAVKFF
ncbi:gp25 [Sodalis phage phiSG1]|uniref:hypothetical protein n=1 Tax=Sodalis phage phiSG1 TaxID=373126 RepID=UPI00006C5C05|nr:hypothetical protein SGPHI_0029 [Sodalis phage phiSG1]ABN42232.1 gp25 [Sodalis phage phiSG1]BAE80492.1 hypothetical protein [Sodalis phage phiSG1]